MAANEIHVGDIGTKFRITVNDSTGVPMNLVGATTLQIIFLRPDNTRLVTTAAFTTNGADGQIEYDTLANDLNIPGPWKIQAFVAMGIAGSWHTDIAKFKVLANI